MLMCHALLTPTGGRPLSEQKQVGVGGQEDVGGRNGKSTEGKQQLGCKINVITMEKKKVLNKSIHPI